MLTLAVFAIILKWSARAVKRQQTKTLPVWREGDSRGGATKFHDLSKHSVVIIPSAFPHLSPQNIRERCVPTTSHCFWGRTALGIMKQLHRSIMSSSMRSYGKLLSWTMLVSALLQSVLLHIKLTVLARQTQRVFSPLDEAWKRKLKRTVT